MKKLMIGLGAVAALALTGCVAPVGATISNGVMGGIVADHVAPAGYNIDNSVKPLKKGTATSNGVICYVEGDASLKAAMENGGITKVHHVDYKVKNILGIVGSTTTIVWGE